jgi:hypothetical protein
MGDFLNTRKSPIAISTCEFLGQDGEVEPDVEMECYRARVGGHRRKAAVSVGRKS